MSVAADRRERIEVADTSSLRLAIKRARRFRRQRIFVGLMNLFALAFMIGAAVFPWMAQTTWYDAWSVDAFIVLSSATCYWLVRRASDGDLGYIAGSSVIAAFGCIALLSLSRMDYSMLAMEYVAMCFLIWLLPILASIVCDTRQPQIVGISRIIEIPDQSGSSFCFFFGNSVYVWEKGNLVKMAGFAHGGGLLDCPWDVLRERESLTGQVDTVDRVGYQISLSRLSNHYAIAAGFPANSAPFAAILFQINGYIRSDLEKRLSEGTGIQAVSGNEDEEEATALQNIINAIVASYANRIRTLGYDVTGINVYHISEEAP